MQRKKDFICDKNLYFSLQSGKFKRVHNKRFHRLAWLMLLLLLAGGCKTSKKAMKNAKTGDQLVRKEKEIAAFQQVVQSADIPFSWFAARGKAIVESKKGNYQLSLNLRMQKGEVIWASVTAFLGLEMARAMITPDSILFFNRLQRNYVSQDFEYLREYVHPGISFELLEAALTGNTPQWLLTREGQLWQHPGGYRLEGLEALFSYMLNFNAESKVEHIFITEREGTAKFNVDYHNFETRKGKQLPMQISVASHTEKEDLKIRLTYENVVLDEPQDFPFTIPRQYKRIE